MKNLLEIDELLLFGFDRGFGYDLRYPHAFNNTHLGTIGKAS
jgi:hypothetical protein